MSVKPTFAELFAGCGGLSLGLQAAGFEEMFANELSPMPAESYAYSLLGLDMRDDAFARTPVSERKVIWLDSSYGSDEISARLNENPFAATSGENRFVELDASADFEKKLVIGDIRSLNDWVEDNFPMVENLDVVSGGPPCQSFSLAGRRDFRNQRNQLPWEFARFVESHQPKIALLENVAGILRPFREGHRLRHAWFEVSKAFALVGYIPLALLVNAKYAGVAQNRPRFILLAVKGEFMPKLQAAPELWYPWFEKPADLFELVQRGEDPDYDPARWKYWDLTNGDVEIAKGSFLSPLISHLDNEISVREAIDDLKEHSPSSPSSFVHSIQEAFDSFVRSPNQTSGVAVENDRKPRHTERVKNRFRIYQIIAQLKSEGFQEAANEIMNVIRGSQQCISEETVSLLQKSNYFKARGLNIGNSSDEVQEVIASVRTKKFSQRALVADQPAPAALSIPDDVCHYEEARTLSVREMARIQGFPDRFVFKGIPTTGGSRRAYQVPQYTQVGNAVPPILGTKLGNVVAGVLQVISENEE